MLVLAGLNGSSDGEAPAGGGERDCLWFRGSRWLAICDGGMFGRLGQALEIVCYDVIRSWDHFMRMVATIMRIGD